MFYVLHIHDVSLEATRLRPGVESEFSDSTARDIIIIDVLVNKSEIVARVKL